MHAQPDWYKTFFHGLFVDAWLNAMPAEHTEREVDFIRQKLAVSSPASLLDVPCGGGRHAIPLAELGYRVTAVDISPGFLKAARQRADEKNLQIDWYQQDMSDLQWHSVYDGAYCFGNSFGYISDDDCSRFLKQIACALKPGARFVLDYPVLLENILKIFMEKSSHTLGDFKGERNGRYDPETGRIVVEHTITRGDQTQRAVMNQRAYTYRQICEMLTAAGFAEVQTFGDLKSEPFALGCGAFYVVARKAPG